MKQLETKRLILRPWKESDAADLYQYARDSQVGPAAGWQPHTSVENSGEIIRNVLSAEGTYAVILKETGEAIGSVGLIIGEHSHLRLPDTEAEIGYWLGVPYWGQGMIPEAVHELIRFAFEELKLQTLWCGYYIGNEKSKRVQEKCGFLYEYTKKDVELKLLCEVRDECISKLTKERWSARNGRKNDKLEIRLATEADIPKLLDIYAYYVENTAITFEYEVPSMEEFTERMKRVLEKFPYLAAVLDGEIVGYAYVSPFKERPAYNWAVETSIYVHKDKKGMGIGRCLYEKLEELLKKQNILNLEACIAYPEVEDAYLTKDSVRFHEKLGYRMVGEFVKCGYKSNRWYNMVWMEKHIGEHKEKQEKVIYRKDICTESEKTEYFYK